MKKTFGQIAYESFYRHYPNYPWGECSFKTHWEEVAAAVLASQWRPVTDPPQYESMRVLLRGKEINTFMRPFCERVLISSLITHWAAIPSFVEPTDPYAEFEKARLEGKSLQSNIYGSWFDLINPSDMKKVPLENLRIKPWTLSRHLPGFRALEPGEEWHRNDFTEEMLPEGWRPMLPTEHVSNGDSISSSGKQWTLHIGSPWGCPAQEEPDYFQRTRRPLPPTKQELERKEFEEAWAGIDPMIPNKDKAFAAWQAARKQKEAQ